MLKKGFNLRASERGRSIELLEGVLICGRASHQTVGRLDLCHSPHRGSLSREARTSPYRTPQTALENHVTSSKHIFSIVRSSAGYLIVTIMTFVLTHGLPKTAHFSR